MMTQRITNKLAQYILDEYDPLNVRNKRERQKENCRRKTRYLVKKGELVKTGCAICGNPKVDAHHPNYADPKNVVWLCRQHHKDVHTRERGL